MLFNFFDYFNRAPVKSLRYSKYVTRNVRWQRDVLICGLACTFSLPAGNLLIFVHFDLMAIRRPVSEAPTIHKYYSSSKL